MLSQLQCGIKVKYALSKRSLQGNEFIIPDRWICKGWVVNLKLLNSGFFQLENADGGLLATKQRSWHQGKIQNIQTQFLRSHFHWRELQKMWFLRPWNSGSSLKIFLWLERDHGPRKGFGAIFLHPPKDADSEADALAKSSGQKK